METLRSVGEFGLIKRLAGVLGSGTGPRPAIGIGDDAAAWLQPATTLLVSTDLLVEGIHFDLAITGWRDLGWKALAVNLSDLAAMGGGADWAFVSIGLSPDTPIADVVELYAGMRELADQSGCTVAGGDTVAVRADQVVGITVVGSAPADEGATLLRRAGGRTGDVVAVTGVLGASAAGLYALQHPHSAPSALHDALALAHHRPQPQLAAGRTLRHAGVRCAIDVSDGLLADIEKLCAASGVGALVEAHRLPLHPAAVTAYPDKALEWAVGGGEDYQLVFTAPPATITAAIEALAALGITAAQIGTLTSATGSVRLVDARGNDLAVASRGWDHFAGPPEGEA